jgi:hypothetical protein
MTIVVDLIMSCSKSGCKKTFSKSGADTRHKLDVAAQAAGWQWKSSEEHYCPEHRTGGEVKKVSKKPAPKSSGKKKTMASGTAKGKGPKVFEFGKLAAAANEDFKDSLEN